MITNEKLHEISKTLLTIPDDFMSAFRRNLYKYIDDKEITINDISERADVPFQTFISFLYGKSNQLRLDSVVKLARALDISVDELIGAGTVPEITRESLAMCRDLPDNDLYLVRWYIRHLHNLNSRTEPNKRFLSVMNVVCNGNGNLKMTTDYSRMDITDLDPEIKGKVFFGINMPCDHYMPKYSPYDILLIANDRPPRRNEHALIQMNGILHLSKRIIDRDRVMYYSIRDGKYRVDESDIEELVGYVAGTVVS